MNRSIGARSWGTISKMRASRFLAVFILCLMMSSVASAKEEGFSGVQGIAGLTIGGGFSLRTVTPDPVYWDGTFLGGFHVGLLAGAFELRLELAPGSFLPVAKGDFGFSSVLSFGGYIRMTGNLYWPIRIGVGMFAPLPSFKPYFQARGDVIGLAYRLGSLILEANLPTYRYITRFSNAHSWVFPFNIGLSVLF